MKNVFLISIMTLFVISCSNDDYEDFNLDEKSQIKDSIYLLTNKNEKIFLEKISEDGYLYDDMILNIKQISLLNEAGKSVASSDLSERWPYLNIPYRYSDNFSSIQLVETAINRLTGTIDCINLYELGPNEQADSFIEFVDENRPGVGGSSYIGRQGGKQNLTVNPSGANAGIVIHEIGHALGLFHEHQRSDRNNFINVNNQNIFPEFINNFQIPANQVTVGNNFDFNSIMLYSSFAFSNGRGPSITKLDGSTFFGQRFNFSEGDQRTISEIHDFIYSYDSRISEIEITRETDEYFNGPDETFLRENFYVNFDAPLTSSLTFEWQVIEYVSNVQTHPSGTETNYYYNTITLPPGQTTYFLTNEITIDEMYDFGMPDGPQYNRYVDIRDYCISELSPSASISSRSIN